jgi:alkanesulfonate monooxygenase SsuD/methylene tetrahydromethanopterin reductase-like flavin-dependent oxidoreductase (luciferase family)
MWDPLASLAAAAAVTEQIRLATITLPLPNRNEVLVAKQAAVIDRVSGGRLTLGCRWAVGQMTMRSWGDAGASRDPLSPADRHASTGLGGGTAE